MRHFSSYGPVEPKAHFSVERKALIERCVEQLVGLPDEAGGHYFTIWGPRQTGKTWIMRRAIEEIRKQYGDAFLVGKMSMQGVIINDNQPAETLLHSVPLQFDLAFHVDVPRPSAWEDFMVLFKKSRRLFGDKRVILLIDEFDSLRPEIIDRVVSLFRDIYLARDEYVLHSLALIGVRAVLGLDSKRGSPFNVQRSMQIPNLTRDEVGEMFQQYQSESGQTIAPEVVEAVHDSTRGQPGLVSWFGELLTEKFNPGKEKTIGRVTWKNVYYRALHTEWNNTLLNLIKKAREEHRPRVMKLFTDPNVPFSIREDWCSYLYMNGIIDESMIPDPRDAEAELAVCRFSSPFVQESLYATFTGDMFDNKGPLPAIPLLDELEDVFTPNALCAPRLLERYRDYLKRLKEQGIDPWIGQPRRQDLHYTEAVGHFHLYAWLLHALRGFGCSVSPEFPTGNGKVDLVLQTKDHKAVIEVKSFVSIPQVRAARQQAATYAKKLGLSAATVALFAQSVDEEVIAKLSSESDIDGVHVSIVAFGWV